MPLKGLKFHIKIDGVFIKNFSPLGLLATNKGNIFFSFFRRNRAIALGQSPYSVDPGSIKLSDSTIDVQIVNNKTNLVLSLQVIILQHNTVRFKINEINPIHPRYEVQDVLVKEPTHSR